jgi:hypothetical protein
MPLAQILTPTYVAVLKDKNVRPTEQEIPQTITQEKEHNTALPRSETLDPVCWCWRSERASD